MDTNKYELERVSRLENFSNHNPNQLIQLSLVFWLIGKHEFQSIELRSKFLFYFFLGDD